MKDELYYIVNLENDKTDKTKKQVFNYNTRFTDPACNSVAPLLADLLRFCTGLLIPEMDMEFNPFKEAKKADKNIDQIWAECLSKNLTNDHCVLLNENGQNVVKPISLTVNIDYDFSGEHPKYQIEWQYFDEKGQKIDLTEFIKAHSDDRLENSSNFGTLTTLLGNLHIKF